MKIVNIYAKDYIKKEAKIREGSRGILIDNDKILLVYSKKYDQYFIPGGGLEENESIAECCKRELLEETGYNVNVKNHYLTINEYYNDFLWIGYYFICEYAGMGERQLTNSEKEVSLEVRWISILEALDIFSKYDDYEIENRFKRGAYLREYNALKEYINIKEE